MITPEQFLTELNRKLINADPMHRQEIVLEHASLMRSRDIEIVADQFKKFESTGPKFATKGARIQYEAIRDYVLSSMETEQPHAKV